MQDQYEYSLCDIGAASYAITVGEQLLRMDYSNPKRVVFYFRDTPAMRKAIEDFWNGNARVEPLHLLQAQKLLKQRIYGHQS